MSKCDLCGADIEETFLEKSKGAIIKINKDGKNKIYYICPNCQRQFGNKLKEELKNK
jgi:uncharacterized protein with PIN domain